MNSVLKQSRQDFEYLVIDGGSTDGSKELIKKNAARIDHWISERDEGIYNAMNKGIRAAKGEYLLFLNSGDELITKDVLDENFPYLTEKDLIYFDVNVIDRKKSFVKKCPEILTFAYLLEDTLPHQSTFIKKTLFDKVGFYDEDVRIVADWKFLILALGKFNASYKHIDKILANYFLDGVSSYSKNWPIILEERQRVLTNEFAIFTKDYSSIIAERKILQSLKDSRKIKLLVRLGLLNKF